jgi:arylsulfatase A-like enzyme
MVSLATVFVVSGLWAGVRVLATSGSRLGFPAWARAAGSRTPDNTASAGKVNVAIFLIDTLQARRLNVYGYERNVTSPNIDALAAQGVLFERACAAAPWTLPSVASLLTSRFPCEHGVLSTRTRFGSGAQTLPMHLKQLGFTTIGLWANALVGPGLGFDRGYDFYRESFTTDGEEVYAARRMVPGRPFFLYIHNIEPHNPEFFAPKHTPGFRDVPQATRERIAGLYKQYRNATWLDFDHQRPPGTTEVTEVQEEGVQGLVALRDTYNELYDACVRLADQRVGSAIRALQQRGEWDSTLFILVSDHGEEMHEHGGWSHDQSVYEELLHVPLIIRFPHNQYAGRRVTDLVSLVDVMPTVLDVLGKPDLVADLRGSSLMPLIRGEANRDEQSFYIPSMRHNVMSYYRPWKQQRGDVNVVVRRGDWKGIWNVERDTFELYDLLTDAGEQDNLAPQQPELLAAMRQHVEAWYETCGHRTAEGAGAVEAGQLNEQTRRNLRALGYVD